MLVDQLIEINVNAVNGNVFPHKDHYWLIGNDSYDRRHSFLHVLDSDFQGTGEKKFLARGMEDHRVICDQETSHVWCNYADGAAMRYGVLNSCAKSLDVEDVKLENFTLKNREKNWCPFMHNNKLFLHTDTYPVWRVFEICSNGNMKMVCEEDTTMIFKHSCDFTDFFFFVGMIFISDLLENPPTQPKIETSFKIILTRVKLF